MTRPPRWFRLFLRALPPRFRESHGEGIVELTARYAAGHGAIGRTLVWLRAAWDVLRTGCAVRWTDREAAAPEGAGRPSAGRWWDGLGGDVAYGLRWVGRSPGFALLTVTILGLGIGATVTVFSVVNALLLRPLPFPEPDRLVWISNGSWGRGQALSAISVQVDYVRAFREEAEQLDDVGGYHLFDGDGDHALLGPAGPERVTRLRVTGNLFSVLGVEPLHGRFFTTEEAWDDGPPAVVLTHGLWARSFGSDPSVVGRGITLDDAPVTVVGVLPPSFPFSAIFAPSRRIDYVAPYPLSDRSNRSGNTLGLVGRLAPDATVAAAQAEAEAITARTRTQSLNDFDPIVRPLRHHVSGDFRPTMAALVGGVTLVLLIVCANTSNLLLARSASRRREMAIRAALGAGRGRLVRQVLVESLLLSGAGAALGVAVASLGTGALASVQLGIPLLSLTSVDGAALGIALVTALGVGVLFGVAPALRGSDVELHDALKEGARGASHGGRIGALRRALVVSEISLACLLLVVVMLLIRSFTTLMDVDLGYRADGAVAVRVDPPGRFSSGEERVAYYGGVVERAREAPEVSAAGLSDLLPMAFNRRWDARVPSRPDERVLPYVRIVTEGYVEAMGMTLMAGRTFDRSDGAESARAAMINEALAAALWPGQDPIGGTLRSSSFEVTVIGVVRDTRQLSIDQAPGPELFFTLRQLGDHAQVYLMLRGAAAPEELVRVATAAVHGVDPNVPVDRVVILRDVVDASVAPRRFLVELLTGFGVFALLLSALGVYGVVSYTVSQRRHEIGIHLALGATTAVIRRRVVGETVRLAALGLFIGLAASVGVARLLDGFLFGITPLDPAAYATVTVVLGGVAVLAGYLPARAAGRATPLEVLTAEQARGG